MHACVCVCVCVCTCVYSSELSLPLAFESCESESCSQNGLPPGEHPKPQLALITYREVFNELL